MSAQRALMGIRSRSVFSVRSAIAHSPWPGSNGSILRRIARVTRGAMALRFGVFDHIEPVPGLRLDQIYRERLLQIERLDAAGFYAYHLAEHHTPAIHSLAPSQNVFLASVAQRTSRLRHDAQEHVLGRREAVDGGRGVLRQVVGIEPC